MGRRVVNVAIASVGGQGGLTLSRVLALAAVLDGYSVRTGETLGMSQRFGSVVSYVRVGDRVLSPTFSQGEADYLLGLELVESLRALRLLRPGGVAIVADTLKPPVSASIEGLSLDAERLVEAIASRSKAIVVPAYDIARSVGNPRALNMVLLGVFRVVSGLISENSLRDAIGSVVPSRWVESSLRALEEGLRYARSKGSALM